MGAADPAPSALDPSFPVPVVRPRTPTAGWRAAGISPIPRTSRISPTPPIPATRYGLVQSLGAQKVFFERPRVSNDPRPDHAAAAAEARRHGRAVERRGVFPGLADAFDFKNLKALSVSGGELGFTETFPIGDGNKTALLADLGAIQVRIEYHDEHASDVEPDKTGPRPTMATITVDPAAAAALVAPPERVCFAVQLQQGAADQHLRRRQGGRADRADRRRRQRPLRRHPRRAADRSSPTSSRSRASCRAAAAPVSRSASRRAI